jgi:hypothetical protein
VKERPHSAPQLGNVLDLSASLIALGLLALSYTDRTGLPRTLLALGFAFFVPGRAIVSNWPQMESWSKLAIPMVFSLALLALLATTTLWAGVWHPMVLFQVEAWLSIAGLCLAMARRNRSGLDHPEQASWSRRGT